MNDPIVPGREITNGSPRKLLADLDCFLLAHDEFEREGLRGLLRNRGMRSIESTDRFGMALEMATGHDPNILIAVIGEFPDCPIDVIVPILALSSVSGAVVICNTSTLWSHLPVIGFISELEGVGVKLLPRSALADGDRIAAAIEQVLNGHHSIEQEVMEALVHSRLHRSESIADLLTKREFQVLDAAARGAGNRRIASQLGISAPAVGNLMTRIFAKLGFRGGRDGNRRVMACREFILEYSSLETDRN